MELIETTNWGMTKQHLAEVMNLRVEDDGPVAYPLCTRNYLTWTQEYKDNCRRRYSFKVGPRITDLPLCKRCERKASE